MVGSLPWSPQGSLTKVSRVASTSLWRGWFRMGRSCHWNLVTNDAGEPISFGTAQAARQSAEFVGAACRLVGSPAFDRE